jgi:hypothetical protein
MNPRNKEQAWRVVVQHVKRPDGVHTLTYLRLYCSGGGAAIVPPSTSIR